MVRTMASSEDAFAFCADGTVRVEYRISELNPHVLFGTWSRKNDVIRILWTREKGGEPVGEPVFCGSVCTYSEYELRERTLEQFEPLNWNEMEANEWGHWESEPFNGDCTEMP